MSENTSKDRNTVEGFEARTRALFSDSVERMDARTRSRLNQARQAAVEELRARRARPWRRTWIPLSGATAAAIVGVWISMNAGGPTELDADPRSIPLEDFELVAETASLELLEDVEFYAWIADQNADESDHSG